MMLGRVLPLTVAKEVRALLPLWAGCLGVMVAGLAPGDGTLRSFVMMMFYCAGSVALGALSIGHEYTHRTLPLLLSQPSGRARLFLVKQLVLAVMLLTLAAVAWGTVFYPSIDTAMVVMLSVLCGLFLAPWLTMLCRNPLAGAVFTVPMTGWMWLLVDAFVGAPMNLVVFGWGMVGLCAMSAVLGWRTFLRLEAIEGRGADLQFPTLARRLAPARTGSPIWGLVKKELGLQQLSIAVAGIAALGWLAIFLLGLVSSSHREFEDPLGAVTFLYSGLLAMVIGSLASAEERQLGTLEWQVLLPVASWKQWAVKVGTTLGLALLLAVALPALLLSLTGGPMRIDELYACAILLLTSVSLYVSSLSTSGIRALLLSLPASLLVLFPVMALVASMRRFHLTPLPIGLFALVLAVVLYFALLNHRSSERSAGRVGLQVFVMAGCLAFAAVLLTLVQ